MSVGFCKGFFMPFRIVLAFALIAASSLASADMGAAMKAYEAGDYEAAAREFRPLADADNAEAQYRLGLMYDGGMGVAADAKAALEWFQKAAAEGHAEAQRVVGIYHEEGKVVEQNYQRAVRWYAESARQGNAKAQRNLGGLYQDGLGVNANLKTALDLYTKAAAGGVLHHLPGPCDLLGGPIVQKSPLLAL